MQLNIRFIELERFKSFRNHEVIWLEKCGPGLHFMRGKNLRNKRMGSNGSGKSSVWHALTWCLYGKTADGLKNPDVRSWNSKKKTRVSVGTSRDIQARVITRTISPNSLQMDGRTVGQEQIDEWLGMSFDVFNHTVLMGQGRPLFFDLDAKAKMGLFSDVLNLERWEQRSKLAKERRARNEATLQGLQVVQSNTEALLKELHTDLKAARGLKAEWEEQRSKVLDDADAEIANLTKIIDTHDNKFATADLALDGAETELRALVRDIEKVEVVMHDLQKRFATRSAEVKQSQDRSDELQDELDGLGKGSKCPTCGGPIHNVAARRAELRHQIEELRSHQVGPKLTHKVLSAEAAVSNMRQAKSGFETKAQEARDERDRLSPIIAQFKARLETVRERKRLGTSQENPHSSNVAVTRKRIGKAEALLEENADLTLRLTKRIERAAFWIKGFRDIRLYVIDEVLADLSLASEGLLQEFGMKGWRILYDIERETKGGVTKPELHVSILSPTHDAPVRWESWSGGEAQRLRLVGALALSETLLAHAGVSVGIEVLDEPTQHLSVVGVSDLCDLLAERAAMRKRQTWLIDHTSVESSQFASILTIVKNKEGSHVEG